MVCSEIPYLIKELLIFKMQNAQNVSILNIYTYMAKELYLVSLGL